MATHIDTIIAEIKSSLKQYDNSQLIDDLSLYDHTFKALRKFGNLITSRFEIVADVKDGKAELPKNFSSLRFAIKCDSGWVESDLETDVLQNSYFWKERVEKTNDWNRCEDCRKEYSEKVITEKIYFHNKETRFCYKNPIYLKLGKHINKDFYSSDCLNKKVKNCPYEITINGKTLYANFSEGKIVIQYYGFEIDEDGKPYIPETPQERLETYLTYHLKRKIFEDIWLNSDDSGIESKIQYLLSQEQQELSLALTDIKAATLTLKGFYDLEKQNKRREQSFEYPII